SYYLIRNAELLGFTENEKEIIANIARYHRKSHPKVKHEGFRTLTPDEQKVVAQLAGILRVADGLDRNHQMSIRDVRALRTRNSVRLKLTVARGANAELEVWGAERKKGLFEEAFGVSLKVDPLRSMQTIRARD
ncbi:MAG: Ppx/GppA family phosphatase, partial [Bacteroidetes bacterium]|nr:Ppx/GppA family phosphatase [Bacteroidota bacterium]